MNLTRHIPSYMEAELITENNTLKERLSRRCTPHLDYDGDRPNINWHAFLQHIGHPISPKIKSKIMPNKIEGYEL